jgi:hypothetical protein
VFAFAEWLGTTQLSVAIQSQLWLTPLLQAIHILMIGVVFVSSLMISLRVLGLARGDESFDTTWQRFAPWMRHGFVVMALTGAVLIIGEPLRQAKALSFWLKLALLVIVLLLLRALRQAAANQTRFGSGTRLLAAAIVMTWTAIIFLGRAIAYDMEVWESLSLGAYS